MGIAYDEVLKAIRFDEYKNISDYAGIIKRAIDIEWHDFYDIYKDDDCVVDEKAHVMQMFQYRTNAMVLCCMIQVWEQDLFNFLYEIAVEETDNDLLRKLKSEKDSVEYFDNNYSKVEAVYQHLYMVSISSISNMKEFRDIVNSIKHGAGKSFETVKNVLGGSILADSNIGEVDTKGVVRRYKQENFDKNTLTSRVLNLDDKIEGAYKEILKFWDETYKLEAGRREDRC